MTAQPGSDIIGTMRHFVDDDAGYLGWLADHPLGLCGQYWPEADGRVFADAPGRMRDDQRRACPRIDLYWR